MEDDEEHVCPLCLEELDLTDRHFRPCQCGYQICLWCWHQIMEMAPGGEGRCPACRTPYDKEKMALASPNMPSELPEIINQRKQKAKQAKSSLSATRQHLCDVRVIQRNLVYVTGLPLQITNEETLRQSIYFGQYGKVSKVSVHRSSGPSTAPSSSTGTAYVTFFRDDDALRCIQAVDGATLEGRVLRACFGTTKYCNSYLKHQVCTNVDCLYLHEAGTQEDSFTKEEMLASKQQYFHEATHPGQLRGGRATVGLPPPADAPSRPVAIPGASQSLAGPSGITLAHSPGTTGSPGRAGALPASSSWGAKSKHITAAPKPAVTPALAKPRPSVPPSTSPETTPPFLTSFASTSTAPTFSAALTGSSPPLITPFLQHRPSAAVLSGRVINTNSQPPPFISVVSRSPGTGTSALSSALSSSATPKAPPTPAAALAQAAAAAALAGRPVSTPENPPAKGPLDPTPKQAAVLAQVKASKPKEIAPPKPSSFVDVAKAAAGLTKEEKSKPYASAVGGLSAALATPKGAWLKGPGPAASPSPASSTLVSLGGLHRSSSEVSGSQGSPVRTSSAEVAKSEPKEEESSDPVVTDDANGLKAKEVLESQVSGSRAIEEALKKVEKIEAPTGSSEGSLTKKPEIPPGFAPIPKSRPSSRPSSAKVSRPGDEYKQSSEQELEKDEDLAQEAPEETEVEQLSKTSELNLGKPPASESAASSASQETSEIATGGKVGAGLLGPKPPGLSSLFNSRFQLSSSPSRESSVIADILGMDFDPWSEPPGFSRPESRLSSLLQKEVPEVETPVSTGVETATPEVTSDGTAPKQSRFKFAWDEDNHGGVAKNLRGSRFSFAQGSPPASGGGLGASEEAGVDNAAWKSVFRDVIETDGAGVCNDQDLHNEACTSTDPPRAPPPGFGAPLESTPSFPPAFIAQPPAPYRPPLLGPSPSMPTPQHNDLLRFLQSTQTSNPNSPPPAPPSPEMDFLDPAIMAVGRKPPLSIPPGSHPETPSTGLLSLLRGLIGGAQSGPAEGLLGTAPAQQQSYQTTSPVGNQGKPLPGYAMAMAALNNSKPSGGGSQPVSPVSASWSRGAAAKHPKGPPHSKFEFGKAESQFAGFGTRQGITNGFGVAGGEQSGGGMNKSPERRLGRAPEGEEGSPEGSSAGDPLEEQSSPVNAEQKRLQRKKDKKLRREREKAEALEKKRRETTQAAAQKGPPSPPPFKPPASPPPVKRPKTPPPSKPAPKSGNLKLDTMGFEGSLAGRGPRTPTRQVWEEKGKVKNDSTSDNLAKSDSLVKVGKGRADSDDDKAKAEGDPVEGAMSFEGPRKSPLKKGPKGSEMEAELAGGLLSLARGSSDRSAKTGSPKPPKKGGDTKPKSSPLASPQKPLKKLKEEWKASGRKLQMSPPKQAPKPEEESAWGDLLRAADQGGGKGGANGVAEGVKAGLSLSSLLQQHLELQMQQAQEGRGEVRSEKRSKLSNEGFKRESTKQLARAAAQVFQMASDYALADSSGGRAGLSSQALPSLPELQRVLEATSSAERAVAVATAWEESLRAQQAYSADVSTASTLGTSKEGQGAPTLSQLESLEREVQNARKIEKALESRLLEVKQWIDRDNAVLENIASSSSYAANGTSHQSIHS